MDRRSKLGDIDNHVAQMAELGRKSRQDKDLFDHSLKVLENAISHENDSADVVLRAAAFLHDVGKPATRRVVPGRGVTFDGHEVVGSRIIKPSLFKGGFSKTEVTQITELIRLHMRSHGFTRGDKKMWNDSAVRRLMNEVSSEKQLKRLVIIFRSDVTSKHASKRAAVQRQGDRLVTEMDRIRAADNRSAMRPAIDGNRVMEILGIGPGPELGKVMRLLNSDEGILLNEDEAINMIVEKFDSSKNVSHV
jgi:polynucleotide adenylyltransferase/metal dependent phosphohydrolase